MATPSKKMQNLPLKWYFQNPVCLTFCSVTRSIFHVGRKVRWVLKSSSPGLLKNGQKFFCMCSGTRENNKIGVQTVLLDTLYVHDCYLIIIRICISLQQKHITWTIVFLDKAWTHTFFTQITYQQQTNVYHWPLF